MKVHSVPVVDRRAPVVLAFPLTAGEQAVDHRPRRKIPPLFPRLFVSQYEVGTLGKRVPLAIVRRGVLVLAHRQSEVLAPPEGVASAARAQLIDVFERKEAAAGEPQHAVAVRDGV